RESTRGSRALNSTLKTLFLWMAIFVVVILLWNTFQRSKTSHAEPSYTEFINDVRENKVAEVTIIGEQDLTGKYKPGVQHTAEDEFKVVLPKEHPDLLRELEKTGVDIRAEKPRENPLIAVLFTWAPVLLIVALWIFFMRQMQTGGNKALSFGKSKAKLLNTTGKKVTFKDVAGIEEAKEELQ